MIRGVLAREEEEEERSCSDWIDEDDVRLEQQVWLKKIMSTSPDQLLATPTEDQKGGSVVFDVPASEMKKSYKFCSIEKSSAGTNEPSKLFERPPWQKLVLIFLAELIGTAVLMLFGCLGVVSTSADRGLGPYSGPISFSCTVAVLIVIIGHISNCHLNPCVTLCAVLLGKLPLISAIVYFIAEALGALIGYGILVTLIPHNIFSSQNGICVTSPLDGLTWYQALLFEAISTGVLILLVCAVWDPRSGNGDCGSLKFLVMIFVTSVIVGPFTGNSLNPVRSLAPAVYNSSWNMHWIYWAGPFSGTIVSTLFYKYVFMALDSGDREK